MGLLRREKYIVIGRSGRRVAKTVELDTGKIKMAVFVDLDSWGDPVGVEILV